MASASRLTADGQVTIPPEVRRKLNLQPGDAVHFREAEGLVILNKIASSISDQQFDDWLAQLQQSRRPENSGASADQIMDMVRPWRRDPI